MSLPSCWWYYPFDSLTKENEHKMANRAFHACFWLKTIPKNPAANSSGYLLVSQVSLLLSLVRRTIGAAGASTARPGWANGAHGALPAAKAWGGGGRRLEYDSSFSGFNVCEYLQRVIYYYCELARARDGNWTCESGQDKTNLGLFPKPRIRYPFVHYLFFDIVNLYNELSIF